MNFLYPENSSPAYLVTRAYSEKQLLSQWKNQLKSAHILCLDPDNQLTKMLYMTILTTSNRPIKWPVTLQPHGTVYDLLGRC